MSQKDTTTTKRRERRRVLCMLFLGGERYEVEGKDFEEALSGCLVAAAAENPRRTLPIASGADLIAADPDTGEAKTMPLAAAAITFAGSAAKRSTAFRLLIDTEAGKSLATPTMALVMPILPPDALAERITDAIRGAIGQGELLLDTFAPSTDDERARAAAARVAVADFHDDGDDPRNVAGAYRALCNALAGRFGQEQAASMLRAEVIYRLPLGAPRNAVDAAGEVN